MKQQMKAIVHVALILVAASCGYWFLRDRPWTLTRGVGLVLAVPSFILWMVARIQLGKSFAVRARAKELVTHGLYSKIRNPIYLFGTAFMAGFFLLIDKPAWLLLPVVVVPMQVIRARKEAKVLEEKFGDTYRDYRSKTWF